MVNKTNEVNVCLVVKTNRLTMPFCFPTKDNKGMIIPIHTKNGSKEEITKSLKHFCRTYKLPLTGMKWFYEPKV